MPLSSLLVCLMVAALPALAEAHPGAHELLGVQHPQGGLPPLAYDLVLIGLLLGAVVAWRGASGRPALRRALVLVGVVVTGMLLA